MANDGTIWDLEEFKPFKVAFDARVNKLAERRKYYDGSMYSKTNKQLGWLAPRIGKDIKPLFLPLARAVDVDAGIIPAGWAFPKDAPDGWSDARDLLFDWSEWKTDGVLYVHYGAQYGLSGLKVSDLRDQSKIVMKPVDPMNFILIYPSVPGEPPLMSIWVEQRGHGDNSAEWAEVITPDRIRTFFDGQPEFAVWEEDEEEGWPNELEFVPYVEVKHIETGDEYGEATFQKAMPLLDEVNQLANDLADIIKKHGEPQWAVIGAEPSDLEHSGDNVWFIPEGGGVEILLPPVDIGGILEFIREIKDGVKEALPELSFDELKSNDQIATETLELKLIELVLKVKRTRPNYDVGLVKALNMVGLAAKSMSIGALTALADDGLELDEDREIMPLDPMTRIELEMAQLALEREQAMGISEGDFDDEPDADPEPTQNTDDESSPDNIESTNVRGDENSGNE